MIKLKDIFFPFLLFLSTNLFANQITNATDFVYDKNLTNYKYFLRFTSLNLFHKEYVWKRNRCICLQITNTKEL